MNSKTSSWNCVPGSTICFRGRLRRLVPNAAEISFPSAIIHASTLTCSYQFSLNSIKKLPPSGSLAPWCVAPPRCRKKKSLSKYYLLNMNTHRYNKVQLRFVFLLTYFFKFFVVSSITRNNSLNVAFLSFEYLLSFRSGPSFP